MSFQAKLLEFLATENPGKRKQEPSAVTMDIQIISKFKKYTQKNIYTCDILNYIMISDDFPINYHDF